ncbi:MAG: hypothetical protein V3V42_01940 [Candidatus Omnitrophota bacterium]
MKKIFILFLTITFLFVQISLAEERLGSVKTRWREFLGIFKKPPQKETREPTKVSLDELTTEEILKRIKHMLETWPEIKGFIPELENTDLEKLDKEALIKIYNRVNIERVRLGIERMERRMEATKLSEGVPEPPRAYTIPARPVKLKPAPSPPKVPTPPPSPPQPSRR